MKKEIIVTNYLWQLSEKLITQFIQLVIQLILARLLGPGDYGTVALVTVFMDIIQVLVDGGFAGALIQKKDADSLDFSTVFYYNVTFCFGLYLLLFFGAPAIAAFYQRPVLTAITRVLGIKVIISGVKNVQQAYVSRHMIFRRFFFASLAGTLAAAALGLWMAFRGFGVWALVALNLCDAFIDTLVIWLTVPWRPQRIFSWERLKSLFRFGSRLLISELFNHLYRDIRQLLIGKWYSPADLAYYNKAMVFPSTAVKDINSSLGTILFPVMSSEQNSPETVKNYTKQAIKTSCYLIFPMMAGLAACAEPMVLFILGEKWLPAVPLIRILCLDFASQPFYIISMSAYKSLGRSDLYMKLQITKMAYSLVIMIMTLRYGLIVMAWGQIAANVINFLLISYNSNRLLNFSAVEQIRDFLPPLFLSLFMGGCIGFIPQTGLSLLAVLILQVVCGAAIYFCISALLRLDSYCFIRDAVKNILSRRAKS